MPATEYTLTLFPIGAPPTMPYPTDKQLSCSTRILLYAYSTTDVLNQAARLADGRRFCRDYLLHRGPL